MEDNRNKIPGLSPTLDPVFLQRETAAGTPSYQHRKTPLTQEQDCVGELARFWNNLLFIHPWQKKPGISTVASFFVRHKETAPFCCVQFWNLQHCHRLAPLVSGNACRTHVFSFVLLQRSDVFVSSNVGFKRNAWKICRFG